MQRSQWISNNPYTEPNPVPRVDTFFFKMYSNSVLSTPRRYKKKPQTYSYDNPIKLFATGKAFLLSLKNGVRFLVTIFEISSPVTFFYSQDDRLFAKSRDSQHPKSKLELLLISDFTVVTSNQLHWFLQAFSQFVDIFGRSCWLSRFLLLPDLCS